MSVITLTSLRKILAQKIKNAQEKDIAVYDNEGNIEGGG